MISAVHHVQVSIPIGSEDRARDFYCGTLGMREIEKPGQLAGRGGFWADVGGFQVHFGAEDAIDRARSRAHVAYLVEDLEECRRILTEKGTEVIDGVRIPGFSRFEFRDPFGNRVELIQKLA